MFDGGPPNKSQQFLRYLQKLNIKPEDIQLIILSHGDFDHSGSAGAIRDLTGAKIAIHQEDKDVIESGKFNWPPGASRWGRISRSLFKPALQRVGIPATEADMTLNDDGLSLKDYDIDGQVVHTPGHTKGSVSIILNDGTAFVGCLAHNFFLFRLSPGMPIYAENPEQIKESWKKIIALGAVRAYPGHGNPFPVSRISASLF